MSERPFNDALLAQLERLFSLQIARIKSSLNPTSHSSGEKKPDLTQQESILLGLIETPDDVE